MVRRIVVATQNPHKLRELQELASELAPGELEFVAPGQIEGWDRVEEGATLEENAYLKATALFERLWVPVVADDSGLEVEALGGKPGVHSAHFVGSDGENRRAVLELLQGLPKEQRRARFRTVLCYRDHLRTICVEGVVEGWIAFQERGHFGFGYDPIFVPEGEERTFGEMEPSEKNRLSHRYWAMQALLAELRRLWSDEAPEHREECVSEQALPEWLPLLMRICAAAARPGQEEVLERELQRALQLGMPLNAVGEGLLQLCLFAGFPAAIEALQCAQRVCQQMGMVWEGPSEQLQSSPEAIGVELFQRVYGEQADRVRERLRAAAPALEDMVLRVAYGSVLSRQGLELVAREATAVATLVAVGGWWRQVQSHLRALLRLGVTPQQGEELLRELQPFCSSAQWERLQEEWAQARSAFSHVLS
ncbi:MAG: RdgB/HAM1 family non-canonical purine NTP pyrophosphatase [Candidatus Kapabacteria bacterium]|nr:RdgB/HAM1 family non-canonical purine NTP pyrophosphatase [Candidatus Kapabacteria bacterium]MDW8012648.1 RdgB/HAM1 family non-canonical purine NTP pyrophosphatase [Bacteroidota bacterium]